MPYLPPDCPHRKLRSPAETPNPPESGLTGFHASPVCGHRRIVTNSGFWYPSSCRAAGQQRKRAVEDIRCKARYGEHGRRDGQTDGAVNLLAEVTR